MEETWLISYPKSSLVVSGFIRKTQQVNSVTSQMIIDFSK